MKPFLQSLLRPAFPLMISLALATFLIGWRVAKGPAEDHSAHQRGPDSSEATIWTCAMHPQIRQPGPGKCPICKMDLIPAAKSHSGGLREINVMPETAAMMDFRVSPVVRAAAVRELKLFGTVAYDERRVQSITAWVGGRLDRMYVDFTGTRVRKGDHLAEIYSPDLFVAQQDLIQARRQIDQGSDSTRRMLYEAAREKLRLLGIPETEIDAMAKASRPGDHVTLNAPQDGIVVEKIAREGDYVTTGQKLYTIADLSMVWVNLEAYEADLPWLRFAQPVTFTSDALPGREFKGRIAFIDPVLDRQRRIVRLRVNVENDGNQLKPGTFVSGRIHSEIDAEGHAIGGDLVGKWVSPMHPEIIKDGPGVCDICGMKLERAEDLGFIAPGKAENLPLLVPASAVLRTGERAVVYVKLNSGDTPHFEGREIVLGPRAGSQYIVEEGLKDGELVLTRGAFKLDSELQLQARPSMMNPDGGIPQASVIKPDKALAAQWPPVLRAILRLRETDAPETERVITQVRSFDLGLVSRDVLPVWTELSTKLVNDLRLLGDATESSAREKGSAVIDNRLAQIHRHLGLPATDTSEGSKEPADPKTIAALQSTLAAYLPLHKALTDDDDSAAAKAASHLVEVTRQSESTAPLADLAQKVADAKDLAARRAAFEPLVTQLANEVSLHGHDQVGAAHLMHCPMAFNNKGADWIQADLETANPYFGSAMFGCGELKKTLSPPLQDNQTVKQSDHQRPSSEHRHAE